MSARPVVSVCIANYNGLGVIDACITSVLGQDCGFLVEVIVHDDASTDGSAQHIRATYPQVSLLESPNNAGFCGANNRMVERASGEFILLLNNDAALFPNALAALHQTAREIREPAILGLPQYNAANGMLIDIGCMLDPFLNPVPNRNPGRNEVGMVIGACLWIPKALWQELGGFPEWFGSIGEDLYLCCRARLAGYAVRALGVSGYYHHVGASFGGGKVQEGGRLNTTFRRRALSERNKTFVMAMTYPTPFVQVLLPVHLVLLLVEGATLSVLQLCSAYLREIYLPVFHALFQRRALLLAGRSEIMRKRRLAGVKFFAVFDFLPYKLRMFFRHGLPQIK